ncbi:MAG: cisplatin damage response ATP-dependent DNA ligase [Defluviicoccus sp.]
MKHFASLLDRLVFTPQRNAKIRLLRDYFRNTPDPDRGYGLAALTGMLTYPHAKPAVIRRLAAAHIDPELFALSYDFVGDLAETTALIWRSPDQHRPAPPLGEVVTRLAQAEKDDIAALIAGWLDTLDASGRYALVKLITGGLRTGVSARLTKIALAEHGGIASSEVEEIWHSLVPPFIPLFAWLERGATRPGGDARLSFRPLMLATPWDETTINQRAASDYTAEWKWDGIRVQLVGNGGDRRIYSRSGDDITQVFPEIAEEITFDATLDGEMLVMREGIVAPFNDLQQRLGRRRVSAAQRGRYPCHVRLYDLLREVGDDLRALPFKARRHCLEHWYARVRPGRMDLSPLVPFADWAQLMRMRAETRAAGIEGLMIKRNDSAYVGGRPKGPWFKLKRDPLTVDCVLMYAQRGHGKRSSFYSDLTFGCWRAGNGGPDELVPVGKTYFGFTDRELHALDRWVRAHTVERFGPVRAVASGLVVELAFDSVHRSARHKSGVAMRFPRIHRIRWDKPATEADRVEALHRLVADGSNAAGSQA